jgi:hypothetical protein
MMKPKMTTNETKPTMSTNTDTNNEVERLRELLNRAIEIAERLEQPWLSASQLIDLHNEIDAVKELARLAPAPEEPVIKESLTTEPAPEWRIKEKGEIIEAEDQYNSPMAGWVKAPWVGDKIETAGRIRTRRPLPKREGEQPYCSRCKYNHAFPCEGSLAGVPLEDELSAIEDGNPWIDPSKNILICIRYLRDEIQKLKEAKP